MNKFLKEFKDRGYFYQCTNENELSSLLDIKKIKAYIGFDCTAESLHVGSLLQIMCLRMLQKYGHQPIVLLGGGTTRIGDPSGKDKTRKILSENEIEKNSKNIERILKKFLNTNDKNSDTKKVFSNNFKLNIKIKEAFLDKDHQIKELDGYLKFKDSEVIDANLVGDFSDNQKINFTIRSTSNEKITTLYSDLAKPFVNRYKFIKGFEEGNLDFHSIKQNDLSNSKLIIDNFKVQEVPALAKLLTLASLQGIADLLTGEGIRFTDFEMKFSNKNNLMKIEELYAIGPAISLLMEGYIESDDLVSLRGTMVPATTINRTISSIPLIGDILVGKKAGEGVFGVSFKVKGPPNKLKTTVNPVKTLTPRFITRTLEKIKKN